LPALTHWHKSDITGSALNDSLSSFKGEREKVMSFNMSNLQTMSHMVLADCRPRFLIADDHAIFAESLRIYLEQTYPVVGVVSDGRALIDAACRLKPEAIVADVAMPILNGLDAACRIREQAPNIKFIFLTMRDDPNLAAAALELGPIAFVLKHSTGTELLKAIEYVLHGQSYLSPKLRANDWVTTKARARQFSKELTSRQRDIVQLYAEGRPMKEIGGLLNLSEKTVEFHKHHIMEAFNLKSNAELILFALKHGLISVDSEPLVRAGTAHSGRQKPSSIAD
jgi:DNA-binding NarL/FixJ family response regulator